MTRVAFFLFCASIVTGQKHLYRRQLPIAGNIDSSLRTYREAQCITGMSIPHSSCLGNQDDATIVYPMNRTERDTILKRHNYWRNSVQPPAADMKDLKWDRDLEITATRWAAQCHADHDPGENRKTNRFDWVGQNICYATFAQTWRQCIDDWASERRDWQFGVGPLTDDAVVGHWTQIVWSKTKFVGCGMVKCRGQWTYQLVCNYGPGGNMQGQNDVNYWSNPYKAL